MAAPTRIHVLDLGMQTVTLAEFEASANGALTLTKFRRNELLADPGADAMRAGMLKEAIAQVARESGIKPGSVSYALPSQSVFTRYLGLPGTNSEDLKQIISFEAQQNIPFPIDEVVWDYQALGQPNEGKLNVVLLAIKTDTLEDLNNSVAANGFRPDLIDVAPMALYNAFRFNYADEPGCSLLIDIGARTTNLIFIEGEQAYSRSIPIGGSTITTAIAKELSQPIEVAEAAKREHGFVSLGGNYAEPEDPVVAKMSKLARTTLTRLHAEIARSISFYRANQKGSQPLRACLAGGGVSMPYMLEFFGEKMQMPVQLFNPFRNVTIASSANADELAKSAHSLGEPVGIALRSLGNCPVEINLRPPSVQNARRLSKRKPFLVAAAICLFLALGQWVIYFTNAAALKEEALASVNADIAGLEGIANQIDQALAAQKATEAVAAPVLTAVAERNIWARLIDELGAKLPPDFIWITKMTPLSGGTPVSFGEAAPTGRTSAAAAPPAARQPQRPASAAAGNQAKPNPAAAPAAPPVAGIDAIEIQGLYLENPKAATVIDDFVKNLQTSELFAIPPGNDAAKVVTQRSTPNAETWAYGYTIVLPLKNPILLP